MGTIPASENIFPVVELAEGAAPSTPPSGNVRLYAKSGGTLYSKDDAGAETDYTAGASGLAAHIADTSAAHAASAISFSPTGTIAATDVQAAIAEAAAEAAAGGIPATLPDAKGDIITATANDTAARLAVGTNNYALLAESGATTGLAWHEILPWHISIIPMVWTPDATTGTWAIASSTDSGLLYPFYVPGSTANSGGAGGLLNTSLTVNDAISWDVILAAGTWDAHFWVKKASTAGIITLNQDASSMGTVDLYAASPAAAKVSITGWTVSAPGKHTMQVKMATKNGSSSNYACVVFAIEFRRTA